MIVPSYWAEARKQHRSTGKQITVRRYGWSELNEEDARLMAERRAEEALQDLLSGKKLDRRERKVPYNGAEGTPIREEILSRNGPEVISRNSYGAHCLNSPRALFADIDFDEPKKKSFFTRLFSFLTRQPQESSEEIAIQRLKQFLANRPAWNLRIYRTPNGLRVIVTHKPFAAREPEVQEFFRNCNVDQMYARMCHNQNCFRARMTAKPWRIGIASHMRPRPGVWPVHPDRIESRNNWLREYEARQKQFAACRFLQNIGSGTIDRDIFEVIRLHDHECRALDAALPLA